MMTKWEQTSIPLEQQRAATQLLRLNSSTVKILFVFVLRLVSIDSRIVILLYKRLEMVASSPDIVLQDVIRCFLCRAYVGPVKNLYLHEL